MNPNMKKLRMNSCGKRFYVMLQFMNKFIILASLLFFSANSIAEDIELLHQNEWSVPKQTKTLLAMPAISNSMTKLQNDLESTLMVKYPGGDEGTLWANELRSWLIALGLSSSRIELIPGSAISTTIELQVFNNQ